MSTLVIADRDGTLIEDKHYLSRPDLISIIPRVKPAIKHLEQASIDLIVATNQSGVSRGYFSESSVHLVNRSCQSLLDPDRKVIKQFFYCKHAPKDLCTCRKPLTGMVDHFLAQNKASYENIYVVGDRISDILLALNLRAVPILVLTGKGRETCSSVEFSMIKDYCLISKDFYEAVKKITESSI